MIEPILKGLPMQLGLATRQVSAENPTGDKGGACRREPDPSDPELRWSALAQHLGKGWKVRPFITLEPGETRTLADIQGPGCIGQFFITSNALAFRALLLRIYWDDEPLPSVETPLGDFFAMGHDGFPHEVYSLPVTVAPVRGCSCYWQMPFRRRARFVVENQGSEAPLVAWRILYQQGAVADSAGLFHAQWRSGRTAKDHPEHVIADGIRGKGLYVGTYLAWTARSSGWWGEGEVKFYLDGDREYPTLADNGTEDYFGGAWCFGYTGSAVPERTFNSPFLGLPLADTGSADGLRRFGMYRWHIMDPVGFAEDLRVTVQALGMGSHDGRPRYEPLADDVASTCFWYQSEPHGPFPPMPPAELRSGRTPPAEDTPRRR